MSRKILFALATTATLAVSALASGAANAHGFGGGGHFGGGHFGGGHFGHIGSGGFSHFAHGGFFRPGRWGHWNHWSHWNHWNHWRHWGYYRRWYWPSYVGYSTYYGGSTPVAAAVSGPIAAPAAGPCTCLTKTYTQDGLVVFADVCTKESATAPVGGAPGQSSELAPQDPRSGS